MNLHLGNIVKTRPSTVNVEVGSQTGSSVDSTRFSWKNKRILAKKGKKKIGLYLTASLVDPALCMDVITAYMFPVRWNSAFLVKWSEYIFFLFSCACICTYLPAYKLRRAT